MNIFLQKNRNLIISVGGVLIGLFLLFGCMSRIPRDRPIILGSQPYETNTTAMSDWDQMYQMQDAVICNEDNPDHAVELFSSSDTEKTVENTVKGCLPVTIINNDTHVTIRYDGLNPNYEKKAYKITLTGAYAHIPTSQLVPGASYTLCRVKRHGYNGLTEAQYASIFTGGRECVMGTYQGFSDKTLRNPTSWTIDNVHYDLVSFNDVYVAPK